MLVSTGFSAAVSPRISFSHDLSQIDDLPIEKQQYCSAHPLDLDFDFCVSKCLELEPSSTADELFFNGKILPLEIKKKIDLLPPFTPTVSSTENEKKVSLKDMLAKKDDQYHHPSSKPFWQFTRSSSLNCDSAKSRSLIRSLSFLSRSNSTGSAPKVEKSLVSKSSQKQQLQKQTSTAKCDKERSNLARSSTHYACNVSQKPPLKKKKKKNGDHRSYYGNGIRISPVLNLPPHYISIRGVSLFGFGSLFCNGKNKKKKK